eukprot:TRINITY_DN3665_c2_g1_i1.p1 TRINITY_DN3665_c2_g1~~TRINITY_DN3665_c2_g1_i1.p1  ORF type:complete len:1115 (+),score=230.76 TRINITY_DN3665_c2_g1_i1:278-3622(+)
MQGRFRTQDIPEDLRPAFGALIGNSDTYFIGKARCDGRERVVVATGKTLFVCSTSSKVKVAAKLCNLTEIEVTGNTVRCTEGETRRIETVFENTEKSAYFGSVLSRFVEPRSGVFVTGAQQMQSPVAMKALPTSHPEPLFTPAFTSSSVSPSSSLASSGSSVVTSGAANPATPQDIPSTLHGISSGNLEVQHGPPCVITDKGKRKGPVVAWKGNSGHGIAYLQFTDEQLLIIRRRTARGSEWSEIEEFTVRGTFPFDMEKGQEIMQGGGGVKWSYDRRDTKRSKIRGVFMVLEDERFRPLVAETPAAVDPPFFGERTISRENSASSSTAMSLPTRTTTRTKSSIKRRPSILDEHPEYAELGGEPNVQAKSPTLFSVASPISSGSLASPPQDTICIPSPAGTPLGIVIHSEKLVLSRVQPGSPSDAAGASAYVGREILLINGSPFDDVSAALERRVGGVLTITFGSQKEATPPPERTVVAEKEVDMNMPPMSPVHAQGRGVIGRSSETGLQYVGFAGLPRDLLQTMSSVTGGRTLALHYAGVVMQSGSAFDNTKRRILLITQPCVFLFRPQGTVSRYVNMVDIDALYVPKGKEDWVGIKSKEHNDVLVRVVEGPEQVKKIINIFRATHSSMTAADSNPTALNICYDHEDVPGQLTISKADWGMRPNIPPVPCLTTDHAMEVALADQDGIREDGYVHLIGSSWKPINKLTQLPVEYGRHITWLLEYGVPDVEYCCTVRGEHTGVCVITPEAVYTFCSAARQLLSHDDISEVLITTTSLVLFSKKYETLKLPGLEDVDEVFEILRNHRPNIVSTKRREKLEDTMLKEVREPVAVPVYVFVNSGTTKKHILKLEETMGIHYQETQRAVAVVGIDKDSNAMKAGMRENTTILTADERAVHTIDDLKAVMLAALAEKRSTVVVETLEMLPSALDPAVAKGLPEPKPKQASAIKQKPIVEATNLPYSLQERFTLALMKATSNVYYIGLVKKIGAKRVQARVLVLSEKAVYLADPNGAVKRTIRISNVRELLFADSYHLAIRVPSDYDLLLQIDHPQDPHLKVEELSTITAVMSSLFSHATSCTLQQSRITGRPLKGMLVLKKPDWVRRAVKNKKKQEAFML